MNNFFVGQKVEITENLSNHAHEIGEVVVLDEIIDEHVMKSVEGWWFRKEECEPYDFTKEECEPYDFTKEECEPYDFTKEELKLERCKLALEEIASTPMVKGIGSLENLYNGLILKAKEVLEEK